MILYIVLIIIAIVVIYTVVQYNQLVKLRNIVKEAFSTMDVYLKKRWDLIPNLVDVVKSYAKYESETFEKVAKLRSNSYDSLSDNEKMNVNKELSDSISKIMVVAENYPELKANENFLDLSNQLTRCRK